MRTATIAFAFCAAVLAAFFISSSVQALNTQSVELERDVPHYLNAATSSPFNITGDFTIEAWVKWESLGASQWIVTRDGGGNRDFTFHLNDDGRLYLVYFESDTPVDYSQFVTDDPIPALVGEWMHLAAAVDVDGINVNFYVNGVLVPDTATHTNAPAIQNATQQLQIGGTNRSPGENTLDAKVDEVRLWNVMRTGSEIADSRFIELPGSTSGLEAYWQFNGTLEDSTPNNHDLLNNNGAALSGDVPFPVAVLPSEVRKSADESVVGSAALQNDNELVVGVEAGKTYIVEGALFVSATNGTPDLRAALVVPSGSDMKVGYVASGAAGNDAVFQVSGASSPRIMVPGTELIQVVLHGTLIAGNNGSLQLQWAQFAANGANPVTVQDGSYLSVKEI